MDTNNNEVHIFKNEIEKHSAFQPIYIKPRFGQDWVLNGDNNSNFKTYRDAYDDSPTNASIINSFVNYIYGEGLIDSSEDPVDLSIYISEEDSLLICQDYKIYGGYAAQVVWSANENNRKPLRIEYLPIYKLGVNYIYNKAKIDGYWYSWDWESRFTYRPVMYPVFTGKYKGENLELLVVKRPTAEPFFPIPDYLSGIPWAQVEGRLADAAKNHFLNAMSDITIVNYNNGRIADPKKATQEADRVRSKIVGTENQSSVLVGFNENADESIVVDKVSPPELNQQNVFYAEEAERKLIVAHSAPPILFNGSNNGGGFSSNADEIEVATNSLYRRNINPSRKVILRGLSSVFKIIDSNIKLDFADFEEEKLEDKLEEVPEVMNKQKFNFFKKLFS